MSVSLFTINAVACTLAVAMFVVFIQAYQLQFVSERWNRLRPETESAVYFIVMWSLAALGAASAVVDDTVVRQVAVSATSVMKGGTPLSVLAGAAMLSIWLTATLACGVFAAGCAVAYAWDHLRRLLGLPPKPTVVG